MPGPRGSTFRARAGLTGWSFHLMKERAMQRRRLIQSALLITGAAAAGSLALASGFAGAAAPEPEFTGVDGWINTAMPISLAGLPGKAVLVNFWTYSCINCRRTI